MFDPKANAQVAILAAKADEKAAEVTWLAGQLERIHVKAPRAGTVVLDDPEEWIGRPVAVGEKVMMVADEQETEVEGWLAVADAGEAKPGARLKLFLNARPLSPLRATVKSVAYEAVRPPRRHPGPPGARHPGRRRRQAAAGPEGHRPHRRRHRAAAVVAVPPPAGHRPPDPGVLICQTLGF